MDGYQIPIFLSCIIKHTSCVMKNLPFASAKTKAHISCAITSQLISAFGFATLIEKYSSSSQVQNLKPLAILCGCTAWFVADLVGNTKDRFSYDAAQVINELLHLLFYLIFNENKPIEPFFCTI